MSKTQTKNRKVAIVLLVAVLGMFGFGYLVLIPIYYGAMHNIYGFGKPQDDASAAGNMKSALPQKIDKSRTVVLQFIAMDNSALNLEFRPLISEIKVYPGEVKEVAYYVKNLADKEMKLQAIPSVSPGSAGKYLARVEFSDKEILKPHEVKTIPLKVVVEPGIPSNIPVLTLSYRLIELSSVVATSEQQYVQRNPLIRQAALETGLI
jgi:cytochrome c oxidase assembly protein subunit 11